MPETPTTAPPLVAPHKVALHAARKLRTAAAVIEAVLQVRGDDGGRLATELQEMRATADAVERLGNSLKPNPVLVRWSRGTRRNAKNYRPGPPGRPS